MSLSPMLLIVQATSRKRKNYSPGQKFVLKIIQVFYIQYTMAINQNLSQKSSTNF